MQSEWQSFEPAKLGIIFLQSYSLTNLYQALLCFFLPWIFRWDLCHYCPQRPCSFWSAPRIATSGKVQPHSGFEWLCKHNQICQTWLWACAEWREVPWIADFRCWTWPEVAILGTDQKESGLWGREWDLCQTVLAILRFYNSPFPSSPKPLHQSEARCISIHLKMRV